MGLTTERKVFLGLAGVAGLALIIDQGLLGPSEAAAEPVPITIDSIDDSVDPILPSLSIHQPAAAILIDRLQSSPETEVHSILGSVFSLTQVIDPRAIDADANSSASAQQRIESESSFPLIAPPAVDLPVLSSVMPTTNGGGAVLGGQLVRVGQVGPDGYRLVGVQARSVIVERDSLQYTIEMPLNRGAE